MSSFRWLYSCGKTWLSLDEIAQCQIEKLWNCDQANWIICNSFPDPVFVDTFQMILVHNGRSYTIARSNNHSIAS
ncbi:hypothetical protein BCV72DRAFT_226505 [Rhizopus microsporus var. microsporus]|uniref:WWE domain-containing protein n=2 Tax=Rhizopus microsporus TaxID=58291 RepID=A0A2G4SHC2_RHIZD|nr:uncharacterized protein RHIMIDRAFT_273805 [Rhizopus microsporus ATCC 52813]ORE07548.1 hypothetical protein BCV72DRAFT_226505 [Rhizopus microsporus var. microsporus]PHZ07786.1 hypothetical protein RHIMIDRAFT_273805 [Rhizopus microsporus ATCC 52813]